MAREVTAPAIAQAAFVALNIDEPTREAARDSMRDTYSQDRRVEALLGVYRDLRRTTGE